jgi:hypothetical protein
MIDEFWIFLYDKGNEVPDSKVKSLREEEEGV